LPDFEDTLRLPCLATLAPAAATTNIAAVEMLKVCALSPPVPTMSTKPDTSGSSTMAENSRITSAAPAISPTVSFFTRRPARMAALITGDTSPRMICRISSTISSWKISRFSMTRCSASCGVMAMALRVSFEEVLQHGVAVLGEDGFGMELHAFDRQRPVTQAHDLVDAAIGVSGPDGDFEAIRQGLLFDNQ